MIINDPLSSDFSKDSSLHEQYYHSLFEFSPVGIATLDSKARFITFNKKLSSILGYESAELKPSSLLGLIDNEYYYEFSELYNSLVSGHIDNFDIECKIINKENKSIWSMLTINALRNASDSFLHSLVIIHDVSEKKIAEEIVRKKEEYFRSIIENSSDLIFIIDDALFIKYVSPSVVNLLGYSALSLTNRSIENLLLPEEREIFRIYIRQITSNHLVKKSLELTFNNAGGIPLSFETTFNNLLNNDAVKGIVINAKDINDRREAVKALRYSEQKVRAVINNLPISLFSFNRAGEIIISEGKMALHNTSEKIYKSIDDIYDGFTITGIDDKPKTLTWIMETVYSGQNVSLLLQKDDSFFDNRIVPIKDSQGSYTTAIGILLNISERKHHEIKLFESEERFRQLADNLKDIFFVYDIFSGTFSYLSPAVESILGFSRDEIYTNPTLIQESIVFEDLDQKTNILRDAVSKEEFEFDIQIKAKDGKKWFRSRGFSVKNNDQNIYRIAGIAEDITEKKLIEDDLRKFYKTVIQSPLLIMITRTDGCIEFINPKFTEVTGYTIDEVTGKKPSILKSGRKSDSEYSDLWSTIKSGKEWRGEFYNRKKSGEYYWESATISPVKDDLGKITHFVALKEDITDRKQFEKELITAKERAEKSDKLKTEFLAQVSHEIRTPLNNILTFTQLLKEELEDNIPSELENIFTTIGTSSRRLINTIELILNLSKIQSGNFETTFEMINLESDILEDLILEFYTRASAKGLTLELKNEAQNYRIEGDKYSVTQALANLIDNAIKYTEKGGIEVLLYNEDNCVCIKVKDTGIGISNDFLPNLFKPFSQETSHKHKYYEGTGLGLTLVKKYIELNSGKISIETLKDVGTSFTIRFSLFRD